MTERPIIFSGSMVKAILAGCKTMTRRLATSPLAKCQPRDTLWVRETWQDYCPIWNGYWCGHGKKEDIAKDHLPVYRADPPELHRRIINGKGEMAEPIKWRSPIHMPRWASRITLEVIGVKVERLQKITPADTIAEGIVPHANSMTIDCDTPNPVDGFRALWNSLHGPGAWEANPEVVAISFKRLKP